MGETNLNSLAGRKPTKNRICSRFISGKKNPRKSKNIFKVQEDPRESWVKLLGSPQSTSKKNLKKNTAKRNRKKNSTKIEEESEEELAEEESEEEIRRQRSRKSEERSRRKSQKIQRRGIGRRIRQRSKKNLKKNSPKNLKKDQEFPSGTRPARSGTRKQESTAREV